MEIFNNGVATAARAAADRVFGSFITGLLPKREPRKRRASSVSRSSFTYLPEPLERRVMLTSITSAAWNYQTDPNSVIITFDTNVNIAPDALHMENTTNGSELTGSDVQLSYNAANDTATWTFPMPSVPPASTALCPMAGGSEPSTARMSPTPTGLR